MKRFFSLLLLAMAGHFCYAQHTINIFNGGFESATENKPNGWKLTYAPAQDEGYRTALDSNIKRSGKYSLSIEKLTDKATYAAVGFTLPHSFEGKTVELRGYVKTKDISSGYAGLWMRVEGYTGNLLAEFMEKHGVKGTTDWKKCSIEYTFKKEEVKEISVGGIMPGNGKAWFDDLELLIDGKPVALAKKLEGTSRQADTTFSRGSNIILTSLTDQQQSNLAFLCQFWGFLKYHHPSIANGSYHWDFELFRMLPRAIAAKSNQELSKTLEAYIDSLPKPELCVKCDEKSKKDVGLSPDYGDLFTGKIASASLTEKLNYVKDNRYLGAGYYIGHAGAGNPDFKNEREYANMLYPDAGYRLLALYRYWTMINYYFPYKDQLDEDWNKVLKNFIPEFAAAKDERAYVVAVTKLIAKVSDTHANLWGSGRAVNLLKGSYTTPIQAKFIEDKLLVTGFYTDTLGLKDKMKIGEEVVAVNGRPIDELVKEYLPLVAASNYSTQLRDLPFNFLLRSHDPSIRLKLRGEAGMRDVSLNLLQPGFRYPNIDYTRPGGYEIIAGDVGYLYPAKYKNTDLPAIKKLFANAKTMVIDMRCYPSDFMPFTFGDYIKKNDGPFVTFTAPDLSLPGLFSFVPAIRNGGKGEFKGNVIVIVNSTSQSNAEYTTMAFQSAPNVRVLGSVTAGADGNVSRITLPGGLSTMISGLGVFYPDKSRTQRVGVKVDYPMTPTVKGIQEGKDELLDKAIEILRKGW